MQETRRLLRILPGPVTFAQVTKHGVSAGSLTRLGSTPKAPKPKHVPSKWALRSKASRRSGAEGPMTVLPLTSGDFRTHMTPKSGWFSFAGLFKMEGWPIPIHNLSKGSQYKGDPLRNPSEG